jgi:hypothetical protein
MVSASDNDANATMAVLRTPNSFSMTANAARQGMNTAITNANTNI